MYLTNANKKKIVQIMQSYALWSSDPLDDVNSAYALKMKAEAIVELVDMGIPHHLEKWARDLLDKPRYASAVYVTEVTQHDQTI